jgi:diamine N-acetyltransferase
MTISVRPITTDNWRAIYRLKVAPEQEQFVASNAYSLLQSAFAAPGAHPRLVPLGIYADNEPVGFAMYNVSADEERFFIMRLMIDARYQRREYARAAMEQLLAQFRASPGVKEIGISYLPTNASAQQLYRDLGFEEIGVDPEDHEMVAVLTLAPMDGSWTSLWPPTESAASE